MGAALTQLIPIHELSPGAVGAIRNTIINALVKQVAQELSLSEDKLVVRDPRPFNDLQMYETAATAKTVDKWTYDTTTTTVNAFTTVTGTASMADQRYVALFGVRDLRLGVGIHTTAMNLLDSTAVAVAATGENAAARVIAGQVVSFIKITVGGADRVIWDLTSMEAYPENLIGFSPTAVIIPQNTSYNIGYYMVSTVAGVRAYLQLIGVVVEPRGKLISP